MSHLFWLNQKRLKPLDLDGRVAEAQNLGFQLIFPPGIRQKPAKWAVNELHGCLL